MLIIDDNSTDGTKESLEKLSLANCRLTVINRPNKMGVGSAHRAAMIYALKNKPSPYRMIRIIMFNLVHSVL